MTDENSQQELKRAPSVPRNDARGDSGFSVPASPFNPVKLELGFILLFALFLVMIIHRISEDFVVQVAILTVYSLCGMARLIFRARQIVRQQNRDSRQ